MKRVGANVDLVTDDFPLEQRVRYPLFKERCTKCHSLERSIDALETGIAPVTGDQFEEGDIKEYVVRMMRKRTSGISKSDALELTAFLVYARGVAREAQANGTQPNSTQSNGTRTSTKAAPKKEEGK